MRLWTALLFTALLLPSHPAMSQTSRQLGTAEREALVAIYRATDGDHWTKHAGWLGPPGTECDWYGVGCTNRAGGGLTVVYLQLSENNLRGVIPNEAVQLNGLEQLDVLENHLSGRIPDGLLSRWLAGKLSIIAEPRLLTDISEIDYEFAPSALLCGQQRTILRADYAATLFTKKCRNATRNDRHTFCEVKKGKTYQFALLGHLLEGQGFFDLAPDYQASMTVMTDSVFESTRALRDGRRHEVVEYAGRAPFQLWVINRAIEGVAASIQWETTTTQQECPRWDRPGS